MPFETLVIEKAGATRIIKINRPQALNALNRQVLEELSAAFKEAEADSGANGVILTGTGEKAFVAGADISEINKLDADSSFAFSRLGQNVFSQIERFPKPVIAAVNGFALGGGCELAMACHLRTASDNAAFGQPEVNLGLIAGFGGTQRLPRLIGRAKATELLLTADRINAETALELGLVNYVFMLGELIDKTNEILAKCYKKSPLALKLTLEAINAYYQPDEEGYLKEAEAFTQSAISHDGKEGTLAFLEKRTPNFKGA